jgi:SAM-dependent methyltransferase
MDDVRIQEIRAQAKPQSNIAVMLEWMKKTTTPIITSRKHEDYPSLVEFPLEEVINKYKIEYFNSTAAYAIAYAIHTGVEKLIIFGHDYTYPDAHDAEKGRACCEFWIGTAVANGVKVEFPQSTTLMDSIYPRDKRLYGYDTLDVHVKKVDDRLNYSFTEKKTLPTAAQIEAEYDHSKHPNALVDDGPDTSLESGERQVSPTVEGVRRDHVARYEWASRRLCEDDTVVDVCCGIGYGTNLLSKHTKHAVGLDRNAEAISYAQKHYAFLNGGFICRDVSDATFAETDVTVCFEAIEHIEDPRQMLKAFNSKVLLASVPNEDVFPCKNILFHHRHYTKQEFYELLAECGWGVHHWYGQEGAESEVEPNVKGRTLIAVCERLDEE